MKAVLYALLIMLAMAFLNPDASVHKAKVKERIYEMMDMKKITSGINSSNKYEAAGSAIGTTMGMAFLDRMIENAVRADNYYVFSLTTVEFKGAKKTVGIGLLGKVFLPGNR